MSKTLVPIALLAMLAACNDPAPAPAPTPAAGNGSAAAPGEGGYIAKVKALDPALRNGVLFRAIRDAQQPCQQVTNAKDTETTDGKIAWLATCDGTREGTGGVQYVVSLADDGVATVTGARDTIHMNR